MKWLLRLFCFVQQFFFLKLRADQSDPVPETGGLIRTVPENDGITWGFWNLRISLELLYVNLADNTVHNTTQTYFHLVSTCRISSTPFWQFNWFVSAPPCVWSHFEGRWVYQTLQLAMTVYAAIANPIISPGTIIVLGFLVYAFAFLDILLEIFLAILRRLQNADRRWMLRWMASLFQAL